MRFHLAIVLLAACSGSASDPATPDAAEPPSVDAAVHGAARGPTVGIDQLALTGANATFKSLGDLSLNGQVASAIASGQLIMLLEFTADDLQNDPSVTIALRDAIDVDGVSTNNYNATSPDDFIVKSPPSATFTGGIAAGKLTATLPEPVVLQGLTITDVHLTGTVGANLATLSEAKLRGPTRAAQLGMTPVMNLPCLGTTLLDVLVRGCSIVQGTQPDTDVDGDGLERFADTNNDGRIDRCTDGNGTVFNGTDCWTRPEFADGYMVELAVHGTKVLFFDAP